MTTGTNQPATTSELDRFVQTWGPTPTAPFYQQRQCGPAQAPVVGAFPRHETPQGNPSLVPIVCVTACLALAMGLLLGLLWKVDRAEKRAH